MMTVPESPSASSKLPEGVCIEFYSSSILAENCRYPDHRYNSTS